MSETMGQVWFRRHWFGSSFAAAALLMLASIILTPNLLRVRNATHQQNGPPPPPPPSSMDQASVRQIPMSAQLTATSGMHFAKSAGKAEASQPAGGGRKIARTSSMDLVVTHPAEDMDRVRSYAESVGGWVERSEASGTQDSATASVTIQVPSARMEEVKAEFRKLAIKVESEKTDALDMTRDFVDVQARLRNLRAEEAQYLQIMHSARKVSDMLEVSKKVSEVRGEIEQTQAEFETLSKQVEMVSIAVSMRAQPVAQEFALRWKPTQQLRISLQDALDGLADYATAMTAALLYLPVLLLWAGTILLAVFVVWKGLCWTGRVFKLPTVTEKAAG